jgi:hypothetical protein
MGPVIAVAQSVHAAPNMPHDAFEIVWQLLVRSQQPLHCAPVPHVVPHTPFGWQA